MYRLILCLCVALVLSTALFAQEAAPTVKATDDFAQLQALEQETHFQIQALEEQLATATPQDAEAIQQRVADLKFQYEIRRLTILLQQAEAQGNEVRAAEIRHALDNWLNPSQPQITAPVSRPAPGLPQSAPEVHESTR
jgi:hypothetical protein